MTTPKGSYKRKGEPTRNNTRERIDKHRPVTAKEMAGAFKAWMDKQPDTPRRVSRNLIMKSATSGTCQLFDGIVRRDRVGSDG